MKKTFMVLTFILCCGVDGFARVSGPADLSRIITFPEPQTNGHFSLEQVIANRRSLREFTEMPLQINQIGQLCFAGQGITDKEKQLRAAPSAGGIHPMQLHVVLPDGLYLYEPDGHNLLKKIARDIRPMLHVAAFKQSFVQNCPCIFIISGSPRKVEVKYRGRGDKFIALEAGHIAENIQLQAVSLGLGSVPVGGFVLKSVAKICKLENGQEPSYMVCVGNPVDPQSLAPAVGQAAAAAAVVTKKDTGGIHSKRVAVIVPEKYFSDTQYYGVEETLSVVGILPDIASSVIGKIKGIEKSVINSNVLFKDLDADDYDAFVFIGGPGSRKHLEHQGLIRLVRSANKKGKILAAIEVMPQLFGNANIVKGKTITSFQSQRNNLVKAGADWKNTSIEIDGNLITAKDSQAARRFATAIINLLRLQE